MGNRFRQIALPLFAIPVVLALSPRPGVFATPAVQSAFDADVEGTVVDPLTGLPVAGASVSVAGLGLSAATDASGHFEWRDVSLAQETVPVTITITAPGYGDWTIQNARLVAADTLILTVELSASPTVVVVPLPDPNRADWPSPDGSTVGALADQSSLPLPSTIRVRVTGWPYCDMSRPYTMQTLDFRDYVKHVLPNEWGASWHRESLRAGAMAAKMYAWYQIARGGKWPDADVYDSTCDQVYNPNIAYTSTNAAVDDTWGWRLMRGNQLVATYYRAYFSQCQDAGLVGDCMGQWDSKAMADAGLSWQQILPYFYANTAISAAPLVVNPPPPVPPPPPNFALRFHGNGLNDIDRVKIQIDNPITSTEPLRPADVGATDFTLEWWMKANAAENTAGAAVCGSNVNWIYGNVLLDRDRYNQGRKFGASLAGSRMVFGVTGVISDSLTICGVTPVTEGAWHHVAVARRRSDGFLWLWVDGKLDASGDGPDGDVSYPDDGVPGNFCGGPCNNSDPYIVLGAEKHDANPTYYLSFSGWLEEMRFSKVLRYHGAFMPAVRFNPDANTVALYHFNDTLAPGPCTGQVVDSSGAAGGPSSGACHNGGNPAGPEWVLSDLAHRVFLPIVRRSDK